MSAAPIASPTSTPSAADLPAPLGCLQRWYVGEPQKRDGAWFWVLPDGTAIPWDDGRAKSFEESLATPDVEDAFSIPYRTGPIVPVTTENDDPGRIRLDPLFRATYGTGAHVTLTKTTIQGQTLPVHARAAEAFARVSARLDALVAADPAMRPFLKGLGGTFVQRNVAGTDRPSAHSYGVSIDLNVKRSDYWRWQKEKGPPKWRNRIPAAIVEAFEAEGFVWGGRWYHYDTMHFEWRPELLDPGCAATGAD